MTRGDWGRRIRAPGALLLARCGALAFAAMACAGLADAGQAEADREYARGRQLVAAGNVEGAAKAFEIAVAEHPDHGEGRYQLALLYSRNIANHAKAEELFMGLPEVAMRAGGKGRDDLLFRAGLGLGMLYLQGGRNALAIQTIRNAIASAPPGAPLDEAYNSLGMAYYYERHYDDAIFELRRAIKANPKNSDAKFNLKTIRTRLEHFQAGKLYSRMGDRERAVQEFRKAIELDPRFVDARYRLGMELLAGGNPSNALRELRRAEMIARDYRKAYEIWYGQALAFRDLGETGEAMKMLLRTVEARPRFADAHNEIGKIRMNAANYDEAIISFVTAIGIDPRTEYVRNLQAAFARKGK